MGNTFSNTSNASAILKTYYKGPLIDLLNGQVPVLRAAEKIKEGWSGSQVVRSLKTSRNQGVGAGSDGGNLPKIGKQGTATATIAAKYNWLRFGMTAPMIAASQNDVGSFVRIAGFELKGGFNDLKKEISRQLSWDGTGDLALVNTASVASTNLVIKGRTTNEPALKYVDVGTTFDVVNTSGTVLVSGVTVNSISSGTASSTTATLVLDTAVTLSVGDVIIRAGSNASEIQGMFYSMDGGTSTIYGVDRSTALAYQGNVSDLSSNANQVLSIDAMQTPFNEGLRRGNVGSYSAIWTDFTSLRYYQKLLTPDKRYASMEADGTFGSKGKFYLDFNGIPLVPDQDMPLRMIFTPSEIWKMYVLKEMEFADEGGSQFIPQAEVDSFETRIRYFANLFNEQPAACAVLQGYVSP